MKPFDLLDSPLEGANLIEASAGTGKTYTLAGLFVRLILEKGLSVGEILVVTFTEAATEELRDRIRKKLKEAQQALESGYCTDTFCNGLIQKVQDKTAAGRCLQEAIRDFDQAGIFTIHGFCQRMLRENAFESGAFFDTELLPDISEIEDEIVYDFWRHHFYDAPIEFVRYARGKGWSPKYLIKLLRGKGARADLRITPQPPPVPLDALEDFREAATALVQAWPAAREEVLSKLQDPALDKRQYKSPVSLAAEMDRWARRPKFPLSESLLKLSFEKIQKYTRKNCEPPRHPFFDLFQQAADTAAALTREMNARLLFLKAELFRYANEELPLRKEKRNIQSFDDLLVRFRTALQPDGEGLRPAALAANVRKKYKAALVDEFQDTDPLQYAIFHNIFERDGSILFLIGDPKQAIYSFRGADLFAYIKAAGHVDTRYTLSGNRRSEPSLITGVNAVFSNHETPFFYRQIAFQEAVPPARALESETAPEPKILQVDGRAESPLRIWLMSGSAVGRPDEIISKTLATAGIAEAVAGEIAHLLHMGRSGRALIGGERVQESDIAVLVRKNREAHLVQQALTARRIPSVLFSMENIFDTAEALEVARVLAGIAEPDREGLVRTALATDILGATAERLNALLCSDGEWETVLARFRDYYDTWEKYGFIRMFRKLLLQEGVRERLLSYADGERRLTNVLHLSEILHQASTDGRLGITGVVKWLARQQDPNAPRLEEHQIRLESDADAVKIVTIHKSKGLEYPIVFCPFNWGGSRIAGDQTFTFHDSNDDWRLNFAIDPEHNPNRRQAEEENLAENLRLLYVSLTRARHRCYLVWGHFKDAGTSAPAYLFHGKTGATGDTLSALEGHFNALTDAALKQGLDAVVEKGGGTVLVTALPDPSLSFGEAVSALQETDVATYQPTPRTFQGLHERQWQVTSFSSLMSGQAERESPAKNTAESPDYDDETPADNSTANEGAGGLFNFPGGTKAGIFFHEVLENLDFTEKSPTVIEDLVSDRLAAYGFEAQWQQSVCRMLTNLMAVRLDGGLSLAQIPLTERLTELEFYFPLKTITPAALRKIFAEHGIGEDRTGLAAAFPERIGRLAFQPAKGFMKGYIDLVFRSGERFYLVDWKSNFLGSSYKDYGQEKVSAAMLESTYFLQYHIYALALDGYLRARITDYDYRRHFGGVYYIFLRGIDPQPGSLSGIFRDRPSEALIKALRGCMIEADMTC